MTAVAFATRQSSIAAELEQEILSRIDRAGLHVCETELRHKLRWDEQKAGPLLDVLDQLEREGLIESALHFRLTEHGRTRLPATTNRRCATAPASPGGCGHERRKHPDDAVAAPRARRRA